MIDSLGETNLGDLLENFDHPIQAWNTSGPIASVEFNGQFRLLESEGPDSPIGGARCVRVAEPPSTNERTFAIEGEGESRVIVDSGSGLVWKYEDPVAEMPLAEADAYCESLSTAGAGFRLANMRELLSIIEPHRTATNLLDPALFSVAGTWNQEVAWTAPTERNVMLFGLTIGESYLLTNQSTVVAGQDRLVFCVR